MKLLSMMAVLVLSGSVFAQSSADVTISDEWRVKPEAAGVPLMDLGGFDLSKLKTNGAPTYDIYQRESDGTFRLKLPESDDYRDAPEINTYVSSWCEEHRRSAQTRSVNGGIVGRLGNQIDENFERNRDIANRDITFTGVTRNDGTVVVIENQPDCSAYGGNVVTEGERERSNTNWRMGSGGSMRKLFTIKKRF